LRFRDPAPRHVRGDYEAAKALVEFLPLLVVPFRLRRYMKSGFRLATLNRRLLIIIVVICVGTFDGLRRVRTLGEMFLELVRLTAIGNMSTLTIWARIELGDAKNERCTR
jgi:hypothetical protein